MEKHINFFELEKAAGKPGCPLCRIVSDRADRYIENMLFEYISDRGFRALHRAAGGFCFFHSGKLVSSRDGLAIAILGRDILEDRAVAFEKQKPWRPDGKCPVCVERENIEEEYLSFMAASDGNSREENEFRQFFSSSDGLCAPHYASLLITPKRKKRRVAGWLKNFHENKFKDLNKRVNQFIELSAYGRQEEFSRLSEKDQLVWRELIQVLRGS